jgi:hypothetical protein
MIVEPLGFLTVIVGLLVGFFGPTFAIYALLLSTLLGAAAAAVLTAMGGANVQPSHVLLGFVAASFPFYRGYLALSLQSLKFPRPGFWLLATVLYGLVATIFMPRMFSGLTNVFAIARTGNMGMIALLPLAPVSGNLTQMLYFTAGLVCFVVFLVYASDSRNIRIFANAVIACAVVNLAFGALDLVTYWTNANDVLSFIRNANYTMLYEIELGGFKRVVGSFTEAAAYASTTLWLFAFASRLWLFGIAPVTTGVISALSLVALAAAFSTTGYAGLACYATIEYGLIFARVLSGRSSKAMVAVLFLAPIILASIIIAMAIHEPTWATVRELFQITFVDKLSSESGVERASWNRQALLNVIETMGLGVGVGSTRTSSWLLAVPVNLGVFGSITYLAFIGAVLLSRQNADGFIGGVQSAARAACLAQLITAIIGGAFIDLGLPFFICAAVTVALQGQTARASSMGLKPLRVHN